MGIWQLGLCLSFDTSFTPFLLCFPLKPTFFDQKNKPSPILLLVVAIVA
jgi:hypothetical protein